MPTAAPTAPLTVRTITHAAARSFIRQHHYSHKDGTARSVPGIRHAWSLWAGEHLVGVVTFSNPVSYTLCRGVCGPQYRKDVMELSRLVIAPKPVRNAASYLIGQSLRLLGRIQNAIVVSYADCNDHVGHVGYVYQAANFLYTGNGSIVPKYVDSLGDAIAHTRRHVDTKERNHGPLRAVVQKGKHRYITFVGDRRFKRLARSSLRYPVLPFPKGPTARHEGTADPEPVPASPRLTTLARTANREHTLALLADRERLRKT
jgi:hypothetical protein